MPLVHLPDLGAQPVATVPFTAVVPRLLPVLTVAPLSKGRGGLDSQELGAAVHLGYTKCYRWGGVPRPREAGHVQRSRGLDNRAWQLCTHGHHQRMKGQDTHWNITQP